MKKTLVLTGMCLSAMLFTQCTKKMASTGKAADEVAEMNKTYTAAQIADGRKIYALSCQKCHQLYEPKNFTIRKWDKILPEMSQKAGLTAEQAGMVRGWVITNARM